MDQNIETAYAHFYSLSLQRELFANTVATVEYTGSSGRKQYDLADPNKIGAAFVYQGIGGEFDRPNTQYSAYNTRGNRGKSQYHGVSFGLESRRIGNTGLQFTARYTLAQAKDNLSSTFSEGGNSNFQLGYLDAFDPDARLRQRRVRRPPPFRVRRHLGAAPLPQLRGRHPDDPRRLADQLDLHRSQRLSRSRCTTARTASRSACARSTRPGSAPRRPSGTDTGAPNEFNLLDMTPIQGTAGSYAHPTQGTSDFGPYPASMTERNQFRAPGAFNLDLSLSKRFRFGDHYALQLRFEAFNVLNHANLFANYGTADIASGTYVSGYKDGNRRLQLGAKFEF